ncbi:YvcK family protein [Macrococcus brunensis]|uniref:Gluconeogenesis factor n=1 Tax=Macrococcus brunensis TaxID=198483 RepID=A0A4R6BG80_9STAP|nr:YvcK family protein [Macrococcus brunensis]TDL98911.1 YvcK family protein [Macrococcus brunensis]ULG72552.1 YvcK family protein [Macrococcus brunensis]ULG74806.1 YvcK family protein [Macrococcus brunensis]
MRRLRICLIGGGTGLSVLARGLKAYPVDITAIVTVADDGGSTGKIRNEMNIPAPGDIRNVLAALSDVEPLLEKLFQYRFDSDNLGRHPVGNLMLAAMTDITDDFGHAVRELSKILNVKGTVIPSTNTSPILNAVMEDGEIVVGESLIPTKNKRIDHVFLTPAKIQPMAEAVEALYDADLIVMGPGSLYTSIMPNILLHEIAEALIKSTAKKLYVSNIMTQPGETTDYTVSDHINAIHKHVGASFIQFVIANQKTLNEKISSNYERRNSAFVHCDTEKIEAQGIEILTDDHLVLVNEDYAVRHDNCVLAEMIYELVLSEVSTIQVDE